MEYIMKIWNSNPENKIHFIGKSEHRLPVRRLSGSWKCRRLPFKRQPKIVNDHARKSEKSDNS